MSRKLTAEKSSALYQRNFRQRMRDRGFVKKEVWIKPHYAARLRELEQVFREQDSEQDPDGLSLQDRWTVSSLMAALLPRQEHLGSEVKSRLVSKHSANNIPRWLNAEVTLLEGVLPSLQIKMHEHGDLCLWLTISGEQILVETVLCDEAQVNDIAAFNAAILRTHKLVPLSSLAIDEDKYGRHYVMFGALSARSLLSNIRLEIETLAENVLAVTEALQMYFKPEFQK